MIYCGHGVVLIVLKAMVTAAPQVTTATAATNF